MTATPAGTRSYFERMKNQGHNVPYGPLGATDLQVSRVGFGGYRLHEFEPEHREALRLALTSGCNLIDTSSNYTDGSSERLIGQVVGELIDAGQLKREEIVIVTKAGYVQGTNLRDVREKRARGQSFPDMVEFQADCWHNISPEFLETQITQSLERLKVATIDVLLLHNPEYFLKASGTRDQYYQRIEKAFRHLETECFKGRIKAYGISSNTFGEDEARSDFTSLTKIIDISNQVASPSKFAVIEFPMNLFESGAALTKNNRQETVLDVAAKAKLGVLTNRPFNSYNRGRLLRLTSFPTHDEVEIKGRLHTTLGRAIELEKTAPGYPKAAQGFTWAHVLRDRLSDLDDLLAWREALYQQIYPSIRQALTRLNHDRATWANDYQTTMQELLRLITSDLENLANQKALLIDEQLSGAMPPLKETPATLSQKLIRVYTGFSQVSSVLVGMRMPSYTKDTVHTFAPLPPAQSKETLTKFLRYRS